MRAMQQRHSHPLGAERRRQPQTVRRPQRGVAVRSSGADIGRAAALAAAEAIAARVEGRMPARALEQPATAQSSSSQRHAAPDPSLEASWQAAVQAAAALSGQAEADLQAAVTSLRVLLPDLDATLAARRAAGEAWAGIAQAVRLLQPRGGCVDWAQHEASIQALVRTAVAGAERDGADAAVHNELTLGITSFFSSVRVWGQGDGDVQRQHRSLLAMIDAFVAAQADKQLAIMQQQAVMAASSAQLSEKLIALQSALAGRANVSRLVLRHPVLMRMELHQLQAQLVGVQAALCELSPADVGLLLELHPWLLEPGMLPRVLDELAHLFPGEPALACLQAQTRGGSPSKLLDDLRSHLMAA